VPRFLRVELAEQVAPRETRPGVPLAPGFGASRAELPSALLRRAATKVGLEGLVPHELRHTAASLAIASGATVKSVRMLGHASATLTLDRCGHGCTEPWQRRAPYG
jgi:integrase